MLHPSQSRPAHADGFQRPSCLFWILRRMMLSGQFDQLTGVAVCAQRGASAPGLIHRHDLVFCAMNDQDRWHAAHKMMQRRDIPGRLPIQQLHHDRSHPLRSLRSPSPPSMHHQSRATAFFGSPSRLIDIEREPTRSDLDRAIGSITPECGSTAARHRHEQQRENPCAQRAELAQRGQSIRSIRVK